MAVVWNPENLEYVAKIVNYTGSVRLRSKDGVDMESKELKEKAKKLGIKPKIGMKKEVLIRSIQTAEGNLPCFGTAKDYCDQLGCCWREDCLPK